MKTNPGIPHFKTMATVDVPRSRNGKHKKIVTAILRDLDDLAEGTAFKVPLAVLRDTKENVRSALNRATRKSRIARSIFSTEELSKIRLARRSKAFSSNYSLNIARCSRLWAFINPVANLASATVCVCKGSEMVSARRKRRLPG